MANRFTLTYTPPSATVQISPSLPPDKRTLLVGPQTAVLMSEILDAGKIDISVSAPGYVSQSLSVTLDTAESVHALEINLQPIPAPPPNPSGNATLVVTRPVGSNYYLKLLPNLGTWSSSGNDTTIADLPSGPYTLEIAPGQIISLNLAPGETRRLLLGQSAQSGSGLPSPTPPTPVPVASPLAQLPDTQDLPGPLRGAYAADHADGARDAYQIPNYDYYMEYDRFDWSTLEPSPGAYNAAPIIQNIRAAQSRGRTYGFGITLYNPDDPGAYPAWLPKNDDGPLWNDPRYIDAVRNLYAALGSALKQTALEFVDARTWGKWGEGHDYGSPNPVPSVGVKQRLMDAVLAAFPPSSGVYLLAMTDDRESVEYAVSRAANVGLRRDSFSNGDGPRGFNWFDISSFSTAVQNRWQTAPFVVENFGNFPGAQDWNQAVRQVEENHLSALKDQNHGHIFATWNPDDRAEWLASVARSGYRLTVTKLSQSGNTIELTWQNSGVAPLYRPYMVSLIGLRSNGQQFRQTSTIDLRLVMPGITRVSTDVLTFPPGSYELRLCAVDAAGRRPLQLALAGRLADSSYSLGSIVL